MASVTAASASARTLVSGSIFEDRKLMSSKFGSLSSSVHGTAFPASVRPSAAAVVRATPPIAALYADQKYDLQSFKFEPIRESIVAREMTRRYMMDMIIMEVKGDGKKRKLDEEANGAALQLSKDDLHSLLEPLSKEQLIALLVNAGSSYPAIAEEIKDVASKDPAHRKLFVRGLAWETSSQTLCDAFEQYGEIEEGAVIMDKTSGKSRGFGFVTFKHMDSAQRALKEPSKTIDGRITVTNLAVASTGPGQSADQAQRKLYIGGLSYDTAKDKLLEVSSKYGEIEEGSVAYDKNTNKSRGFVFVTFKTVEATKQALKEPNKTIDGRTVTMKLAADGQKEKLSSQPAISPQMQTAYGTDYPSLNSYHRPGPQVPASAPPPIGFSAYPSGLSAYASQPPYATQPTYGGISSASQYGVLSSTTPYSSNQYAKYATSLQDPRLVPS